MNLPAAPEDIKYVERELDVTLPPSYRRFLLRWNGGILFDQDYDRLGLPASGEPVGIAIYPVEVVPQRTQWWREYWTKVLQEDMSLIQSPKYRWGEAKRQEDLQRCERDLEHVPRIVVVGENLESGNYFGFDLTPSQLTTEPPVIFLPHEGCSISALDVLGESFAEFIRRLIADPVTVLGENMWCITRYDDKQTETQWIPVEYQSG
jgi:cell wall assembly regulator SMI1